ncbi:hypothetical protein Nepgr_026041 [Nepenthes gracilis]|uniref:Uncharacterized protein n=1 Tax=Nepenthes gracilis TaxID=150966 RepID=A0AAD3T636_NEPGR|nr:hypothetical protein Nepgr_026041 [Nepenthes gracilis]
MRELLPRWLCASFSMLRKMVNACFHRPAMFGSSDCCCYEGCGIVAGRCISKQLVACYPALVFELGAAVFCAAAWQFAAPWMIEPTSPCAAVGMSCYPPVHIKL